MNGFLDVLRKVERLGKDLQEKLALARQAYGSGYTREMYAEALRAEEIAERLVLLTRVLPVYTGLPGAALKVEEAMKNSIPVEIGFTAEGWFSLRIPALLPKKESGSSGYIRSFLYPAMKRFFDGKPPVRYQECVLAYRHVYDRERPKRRMRDHDNIEVNMVSDIVALYVMPDDGPAVCSHYYCSTGGDTDRTEVYVLPKGDFPIWLAMEKALPEQGVKLYENRPV